jgi:hypothetical protein
MYAINKMAITGSKRDYHAAMNSTNATLKAHWDSIAVWCNANSVDPRAYIEWCFMQEFPGYPMPSKFDSYLFKSKYIQAGKPDPEYSKLKLKYELMVKRLEKLTQNAELIECLLDPLNTFDPVFIYTIAKKMECHDKLPSDILLRAQHQVQYQPVYADKFKGIIPEELFISWT